MAALKLVSAILALVSLCHTSPISAQNTTYTNPILPGWHSDPSCTYGPAFGKTYFCTSSTFLAWPGLPIYASKDLQSFKLVSHALTRTAQIPEMGTSVANQQEGIWAPTLRYHNGTLYLITVYISFNGWNPQVLLFTSQDPFKDDSWSDPIHIPNPSSNIDPDIFWDDDGKVYVALSSEVLQEVDLSSSPVTASSPREIWTGTGWPYPEQPNLYKRPDGYYYLVIAEGGTELNHSSSVARSKDIYGPYESYAANPILTNRGTAQYFQTVGAADLFEDEWGRWWGTGLATRSGPKWEIYPMGREAVLFPVTWGVDGWPVLDPVRGKMSGWNLPPKTRNVQGTGPFVEDPDIVDFEPGSLIPKNFINWRIPIASSYTVSPPEKLRSLRLTPSRANLTGDAIFKAEDGLTFIARRQIHTLFKFSVDISCNPTIEGDETGLTVFLTQLQHIDIGIALLRSPESKMKLTPHLRFRVEASGKPDAAVPATVIKPVPTSWAQRAIQLQIRTVNDTHYEFAAASARKPDEKIVLGLASALIVSGGSGSFVGTILGAFATTNGRVGNESLSYLERWRYTPIAQEIDFGVYNPA
jgi:beta-xylosidase